ncbi:MAG TPA: nickel-dependent lactate racemase [Candidatus Korarchaeota archaeon]|nr:nickel-dependent lactate racemase [Candidatus Korarchaeota archaeon]
MRVPFPYGEKILEIDLPGEMLVSKRMPAIENLNKNVRNSLENPINSPPLSTLLERARKALIIVPDITRACPTKMLLQHVISIAEGGPDVEIKILIATGLHRSVIEQEKEDLVGKEIIEKYSILIHDAKDTDDLIDLKKRTSFGTPIEVNRHVMSSDLVIGIGLIEPHFFAGYSGGRKTLLPGVASAKAIFNNHGYKMIEHPNSRCGILEGNPIHEDMLEFMKNTKLDFIVNVTLDKDKRVSGIFSGNPIDAHLAGVRELNKYVRTSFRQEADIVITTNGGYPLDRDIYQAVKGMDMAAQVVKENGVIIIASECRDGLGGHEEFLNIVKGTSNPEEILERIKRLEPIYDQWEAQILARVLKKARVIVVTENLSPKTLEDLQLMHAKSLEEAIEKAHNIVGKEASIISIPEGPYIIPFKVKI